MADYKYLINKASFTGYEDISVNIEDARLNVFIKKAQQLDLEPFLNPVFYHDLYSKIIINPTDGTIDDTTPQNYKDLMNGAEYQDRNGNTLFCEGLIPALIYWTFARFIESDSVRFTATGPVQKMHDEATPLKPSDIAKLVSQQRSVANAYANKVIMFLDNKKADYEFWQYNRRNEKARQPGPRISGVDATVVRSGPYGRGYANGYGYDGILNGLI